MRRRRNGQNWEDLNLWLFGPAYMCEVTFSALVHTRNRRRKRVDVDNSLVTAVSTLAPELEKLLKDKRDPASHPSSDD